MFAPNILLQRNRLETFKFEDLDDYEAEIWGRAVIGFIQVTIKTGWWYQQIHSSLFLFLHFFNQLQMVDSF